MPLRGEVVTYSRKKRMTRQTVSSHTVRQPNLHDARLDGSCKKVLVVPEADPYEFKEIESDPLSSEAQDSLKGMFPSTRVYSLSLVLRQLTHSC